MLNLQELNALNRQEFVQMIGPTFEHSPWIAEKTWLARPFQSREQLHRELCATVTAAPDEQKVELIRAHPDLVGRAILTDESRAEQKSAGLGELSPDETRQFAEYNRQYRERFDFPFVICARLNKKDTILQAFPERLKNSATVEKETALQEIFKIAALRLQDLVA